MFAEYTTTRARKDPKDLASAKDWQPQARRLYITIKPADYGRARKEWTDQDGRKHKRWEWKQKPYCKLMLNQDPKAEKFAQLVLNTEGKGLAVQVDPADPKRHYVSVPKGALEALPEDACMLNYERKDGKITLSAK